MYKVYCDEYILHDPGGDDAYCMVLNGKVTKTANCADSFTFTIYPQNRNAARIHRMTSMIKVVRDGEIIFTGRPVSFSEGWEGQKAWKCEGILALLNDTILRPYSYTGSVRGYLEKLINSHNGAVESSKQFTLRTVTVTDPNDTIVRSNSDYVPTIKELLDKTVGYMGGYLVTEISNGTIYIDYLADSTDGTAQTIEIAKNLIDFKREQDAGSVATAIIPLGAKDEETGEYVTIKSVNSGVDYLADSDTEAEYGLIYTTEKWDDVTVPSNLLRKAQARLAEIAESIPKITLTAIDLSTVDQSIDPIRMLDYVTVKDDTHSASGRYLITERVYNISAPENDRISFGGAQKTISGYSAKSREKAERESEKAYNESKQYADGVIERITEQLTGEDGGYLVDIFDANGHRIGDMIMDTNSPDTATNVWLRNLSGWGHSKTGINGPYTTAITQDGKIVADFILAGTLNANVIRAGVLTDDLTNPHFYLNLETGELRANFSQLKSGGNDVATQQFVTSSISSYDGSITSLISQTYVTKTTYNAKVADLQSQIDTVAASARNTWVIDHVPTLLNAPASDWTTAQDKADHVGDIAYVSNPSLPEDSYGYRFQPTANGQSYEWVLMQDATGAQALSIAQQAAQDIAGLSTLLLTDYSTTQQMNSAISQSASGITTSVSQTYSTKLEAQGYANTAKSDAESYTDGCLLSYSTTQQMNSAISQSASGIIASVSETYSTKLELQGVEGDISDLEDALTEDIEELEAQIQINADKIALVVSGSGGQYGVNAASIVTAINAAGSSVEISADHINLNGVVTANNGFKILSNGSMETIAGKIGGWNISATELSRAASGGTTHTYTIVDVAYIKGVLNGTYAESSIMSQYPYLDLDGDGHITYFDLCLARSAILGYIPNGTAQSCEIMLNPTKGYGAVSVKNSSGDGFNAGAFGVYSTNFIGENLLIYDGTGGDIIETRNGIVATFAVANGDLAGTGDLKTTANTESSGYISIANNSWATAAQLTLTAGRWVIAAACAFDQTSGGCRKIILTDAASGTTAYDYLCTATAWYGSGYNPYANMMDVVTLDTSKTFYLRAHQNSGTTVYATGNIKAIRIS